MSRRLFPVPACLFACLCAAARAAAQVTLAAADAAPGDSFGDAVAVSGERVLVGASGADTGPDIDSGAAYVFLASGGAWVQEAKLVAPDAGIFDLFGIDVGLSGDTAVVGAPEETHGGLAGAGAAYVFVRSGTAWPLQAKLTVSDDETLGHVASAVAVEGDTVVLGKPTDGAGALFAAGAVYVFERRGTVWTETAKLRASDATAGALFGGSVAVAADTLLVGAQFDAQLGRYAGAAYVFVRTGGSWIEQGKLLAEDGSPNEFFGRSVALSGDTALVGAWGKDHAGGVDAGAAYVFVRSGRTWSQQARLVAPDAAPNDKFGVGVGLAGDSAIIGAPENDWRPGFLHDSGTAHVFLRRGTAWRRQAVLWPTGPASGDQFGAAVAVSDSIAAVGARFDDHAAGVNAGSALVIDIPAGRH